MRKIVFGLFLIVIGCNNNDAEKNSGQKSNLQDSLPVVSKSSLPDTVTAKKKENASSTLYEYKNDTLLQTLAINYISKQEINFELITVNKIKNKTSTLTGTAEGKLNQDPEMDEDDEGNSYAATEYHYTKDGCSLSIRIDMDTKNKAKVFEYTCDKLHDSSCPFASVGLLKRVQK